jgi:PIN domain nuclease of toxin-antitoxin system
MNFEWHHKDPFDRLLAAQCIRENMAFISRDSIFESYFDAFPCNRIW